jgi:hypothetical protein
VPGWVGVPVGRSAATDRAGGSSASVAQAATTKSAVRSVRSA